MGTPFLGEMRFMAFGFAPRGWAACDGTTMAIRQNAALFAVIGTTWGGDGRSTFKLPDLRGRVPVGPGGPLKYQVGQGGGEEGHMLANAEVASHTHTAQASANTTGVAGPANCLLAASGPFYGDPLTLTTLHPLTVAPVGGTAHENRQPYNVVNLAIALQGTFPSRD